MSHPLPDMMQATMEKIRQMVDVNPVIGDPISTPDGVTIIPVSKVSFGFGVHERHDGRLRAIIRIRDTDYGRLFIYRERTIPFQ